MDVHDFEGATIAKIELLGDKYYDRSIKIICTNGRELLILPDSPAYDHWLNITTSQPSRVSEAIADMVVTAKELLIKLDAGLDIDGILETFKALVDSWSGDVIQGGSQIIVGRPGNTTVQLKFDLADTLIMSSTKFDALVSAGALEVEPMPEWKGWKNWYVSCPVLITSLEKVEAI